MSELELFVETGTLRAISVPLLSVPRLIIGGPCHLHGWSFREAFGNPNAIISNPDAATANIVAATAGNVSIPVGASLTGFDIDLSVVGTANMVITVTNVPNGPYTYDLAAGQSRISVSYPTPLPPTGGQPNIAWSATAAATGTITAAGVTFSGGSGSPVVVEISSGNTLLGEAEMAPGKTHNAWFGVPGLYAPQGILLTNFLGSALGAVYVSYRRE